MYDDIGIGRPKGCFYKQRISRHRVSPVKPAGYLELLRPSNSNWIKFAKITELLLEI